MNRFDDDDDDWDDGEDAWSPQDDESSVEECPKCGADVYEDAPQCPICGEYLTHRRSGWQAKPVWWKWLGLAGIIAVIASLTFLGF